MASLKITWGKSEAINYAIYLGLSFVMLAVFTYFFLDYENGNQNIKFSYSLMIIVSVFGGITSIINLIKVQKGYSEIIIENDKMIIQNRSFMYKEDFEFEVDNLKGLTLKAKVKKKNIRSLQTPKNAFDLCVLLKDKKGEISVLPHLDRSPKELKLLADDIQKVIMKSK